MKVLSINGLPLAASEKTAEIVRAWNTARQTFGLTNGPAERTIYHFLKTSNHYLPPGVTHLQTARPVVVVFSNLNLNSNEEEE